MMRKDVLVMACAVLIISCITPVFALPPNDKENAMIQLAMTDYEVVYQKLYERCLKEYPETAGSFKEALNRWGEINYLALKELRLLFRDTLVAKARMSVSDASSMISSNTQLLTELLQKHYTELPASELQKECSGQFAEKTLSEMDFAGFLKKHKSKMSKRQE